jgi:hypothetical protein
MNEQLPADLAAEISELESLWSYDAEQQGWLVYRPGPLGALTTGFCRIACRREGERRRNWCPAGA